MDFTLTKELEMLRKAVREFANKKIAPNVDQWDKDHYFPYKEAIKPMGELGFWGTVIPEEYEGEDMGWMAAMSPGCAAPCGCRSTCRCWAVPTPSLRMAARS